MGPSSYLFHLIVGIGIWTTSAWVPSLPSLGRQAPSFRPSSVYYSSNGGSEDADLESVQVEIEFNELHTLLRDAVAREDYLEASRISNILSSRLYGTDLSAADLRSRRRRMSWKGLGAAPWLIDRLDALNYTFPTTIQVNAMEAVNAILNSTDEVLESSSLEERVGLTGKDLGIVVSGATGSGKTLAFLVPLLSLLSESLFYRQRLRVSAEELIGDVGGDLLDRLAIVTSPVVRSSSQRQMRQNGAIATGASISTLGKSGKDVKSPLALIVVPSRELGVQTAMLLYQLVGGNIKTNPTESSGKANFFRYRGPKGVRIACVLDDEDASFGMKLQTDVAITTPQYLGKLISNGDLLPSKLRVIIYDEADLALEETNPADLKSLFDDSIEERESTRLTVLVGASVTEALGNLAVSSRILPAGKSWIATATRFAPLESEQPVLPTSDLVNQAPKTASLQDLAVCLYPGLKHERVIVTENSGLLALTRLLRKELERFDFLSTNGDSTKMIQRPRVVVFFPDEAQARSAIEPLRDALWGEHRLCVLLPKTGATPLEIMDKFKRNETTVMLATPNSVRGLDFPALTHVYTLYLPFDDPREYVHLAGRVGRVGQLGTVLGDGGHVVSILREDEASQMDELASTLGFEFQDISVPIESAPISEKEEGDPETVEKLRRFLEDMITLLDSAKEPAIDLEEAELRRAAQAQLTTDDYDGDEEDDDEE